MAPKKKSDPSLIKIPKEKLLKAKTKAKTILKVKIQHKKLKNAITEKKTTSEEKNPANDLKKMMTHNDMKLDRMNEVARAQLVKDCPVANTESAQAPEAKKSGRKKKIIEPETAEIVPKKIPKLPTKAKTKNTTLKVANTKTPKVAAPKRKALNSKVPLSISPPPKIRKGRPLKRGKPKAQEGSTITAPSIPIYPQPEIKTPVKDTQKTLASPVDPKATENNSDSRRTSVTSAPTSEWSWTKDISGSSTTTCITVTSNDFVRIDGKLPELKIPKLKALDLEKHNTENKTEEVTPEVTEPEHSLSEDSSSSSSSSSSSPSRSDNTAFDNGLNLSTSSISPPPYSPTYTPHNRSIDRNKRDEVTSILEMVAPKLKSLELDFPDIEDDTDDFDMDQFEENISKHLEEEYNTILECNFLNRILSDSYLPQSSAPEIEPKHSEDPNFAIPDLTVISNRSAFENVNDVPSNITRRRDTYDPYEDDDVLSIFADNMFDSARISSAASNHEEYVPLPLTQRPNTTVTYLPSKKDASEATIAKKPVCEKQNADSTSIHKEPKLDDVSNETPETVDETVGLQQEDKLVTENKLPPLTISYYPCPPGIHSITLRGVCFFNLISTCTKKDIAHISFYHRFIDEKEFNMRLVQLGEAQFFQEYNLIASRTILRNKYVKCFIDECQRRELPKILVEIVIDFLYKTPLNTPKDEDIRVEIVEHALVHLNKWNLIVCEQLLAYKVEDDELCEFFMKIIARTQNFSRFKTVFVNLTDYMVRANRTFEFVVAVHILERVCILPFEARLAKSLISIMERTDRKIFKNNMSNVFDMLLNNFNKELHNKFVAVKMKDVASEKLKPVSPGLPCPPTLPSPCGSYGSRELEPLSINPNSPQDYEPRYTSPDTTNTDNVKKPVTEPTIIRTLNHLKIGPPNMNMCNSGPRPNLGPGPPLGPGPLVGPGPHLGLGPPLGPGSSSGPGPSPGPRSRGKFRNWNHRTHRGFSWQYPRMPFMRPPRPMTRPPSERPQFNFHRRYVPDY